MKVETLTTPYNFYPITISITFEDENDFKKYCLSKNLDSKNLIENLILNTTNEDVLKINQKQKL
jgi:hypothetical protein